MVKLFYSTYISVDLAHHEILRALLGKSGLNVHVQCHSLILMLVLSSKIG